MYRPFKIALVSLIFNMLFATYHLMLGVVESSWWLITLGAYYLILSAVRFLVLRLKAEEGLIAGMTGWMLIVLSAPLIGTVILSVISDRGYKLHMILMIAIAAYAFTKVTLATINMLKLSNSKSMKLVTLRNISFADAVVSIFALQRSMLVSFEGMTEAEIMAMNAALGSAVCITVLLLGINLLRKNSSTQKTSV